MKPNEIKILLYRKAASPLMQIHSKVHKRCVIFIYSVIPRYMMIKFGEILIDQVRENAKLTYIEICKSLYIGRQ